MPATPLQLMHTILESAGGRPNGAGGDPRRWPALLPSRRVYPGFESTTLSTFDLDAIRATLASQVIGQPEPIQLIVNLIATMKARMVVPGRPLASLMFIGPTGVGKTEMAKAIAHMLYNDPQRMIRIDMSEYASPWSLVKLIGKPGEGNGSLTSPIREYRFR